MKQLIIAAILAILAAPVIAASCGAMPMAPMGCTMVCQCDRTGQHCSWVALCR